MKTLNKIGIVGSGTAGLISALLLNKAFPKTEIFIVSSSNIGIVGVGEGSTEHWSEFMRSCQIPLNDMLAYTDATHKYGIRFENWNSRYPDYFHSVSGDEEIFAWGLYPTYMGILESGKTLTSQTTTVGLVQNKIRRVGLHNNTNQFHFDTFKLNDFFVSLCVKRMIKFIDDDVVSVNLNAENGNIESINLKNQQDKIEADFWIDASGFNRVLMSEIDKCEWKSFENYLLTDSAIAFPTESDPSGQIRPYTRARAADAGWVWEIPTQTRRGNGYVYSSKFVSDEEAIKQVSNMLGFEVQPSRTFKFNPGHLKNMWVKNCSSVGLASAFVEPLEATSIGSTIQQIKNLIPFMASYKPGNKYSQESYNKKMSTMMDNILSMMRLHYLTDRTDTDFWIAARNAPINDNLQELLNLWTERTPMRYDIPSINGEMFLAPHMMHVAQGQNLLNEESATIAIDNLNLRQAVEEDMSRIRLGRTDHELVDHAQALKEIDPEYHYVPENN